MFNLFMLELKRRWLMFITYPMDELLSTAIWIFIAALTVMGLRYAAGNTADFGHRLDALVIGWSLWILVTNITYSIHSEVADEAKAGTLQQIMMTRFSVRTLLLMRALADLSVEVISAALVLVGVLYFTGIHLHFSLLTALPALLVIIGALGLSLILGAVRIAFRRIGGLLNLAAWVLFALVLTPVEELAGKLGYLCQFIPLVPALSITRDLMARGQNIDWTAFSLAAINAAFYFVVGMFAFHFAEQNAKSRCTLDKY